jgi:hypothetical protein
LKKREDFKSAAMVEWEHWGFTPASKRKIMLLFLREKLLRGVI